jgi:hypothetical protein
VSIYADDCWNHHLFDSGARGTSSRLTRSPWVSDVENDPADPWGCVQLCDRLRITYPEDKARIAARLRQADDWDQELSTDTT